MSNVCMYQGDLDKYNKIASRLLFLGKQIDHPLVSFCIPTYNRPDTLYETILSIVRQRFDCSYEVIVCDNSGDLSDENQSLREISKFNNYCIKLYVNEQNIGMTGNWNRLIQLASGKFISFIHDDDLLSDNYSLLLGSVINRILNDKIAFGFLKVRFCEFREGNELPLLCGENFKIKEFHLVDSLISGIGPTTTPTCGMLFSKDCLLALNGFKEEYYPCADHVVGFVIEELGYRGFYTEEMFSYYRWGRNETLSIDTQKKTYCKNKSIRTYFYQHNRWYRLFGDFFEKPHQFLNLIEILSYCKSVDPDIAVEDIDDTCEQPSQFNIIVLKILKKICRASQKLRRAY